MNGNKLYKNLSICLFTRVCHCDALLLNWPGMSICKNSLEQRVSTRIALLAHFWLLVRARLKRRQTGVNMIVGLAWMFTSLFELKLRPVFKLLISYTETVGLFGYVVFNYWCSFQRRFYCTSLISSKSNLFPNLFICLSSLPM